MTTTVTRCAWSDLPTTDCAHCPGATTFSTPPIEAPNAHTSPTHQPSPAPTARRRLPVLGIALEHGQQPDIHDMVDELTRTHGHRERYDHETDGERWTSQHITEVPALIHQLLAADPAASKGESGSAAVSKPAARIECVDTLILIDHEAAAWLRRLGDDDPGDQYINGTRIPGSGTIRCLQLVHTKHAAAEHCGRDNARRESSTGRPSCCTRHAIEHDVRRWWTQARIVSGWDSPAWRPDNTCPVCDQRRSIRINLTMQTALCIECRTIWRPDEIGLLAEWIRTENREDDTTEETS